MAAKKVERFQLVAGDVALDLVNTLDFRFRESGSVELLECYDDLLAFMTQSGLLTHAQARGLDRFSCGYTPKPQLSTPFFFTKNGTHMDHPVHSNRKNDLKRLDDAQAEQARILRKVKNLREALSAVLYALLDGDDAPATKLKELEAYFKQANAHRHLVAHGGHLAWKWEKLGGMPAAPLWLLADKAEDLLLSERFNQMRTCAASTCRWLFLDASKNRTRRWCDMKICGNRMKAKRFQSRKTLN